MCEKKPPVQRMNFVNAELTKISVNTYVTTKISYANMLADICDRIPGADVDAVTKALGADTRIGAKYLKGAMGYGGPCFPRDNVAFAAFARKIGARADVAEATDRINNYQIDRLTGLVGKFAKAGTRIAILGMSYKPQTPVVEESHSVKLAAKLADAGYVVVVHDPLAQDAALAVLGDKVVGASSIEDAVRGCDLLIVATAWPEYKAIDAGLVQAQQRPAPHGARPVAHPARRQIRRRGRRALSGIGAVTPVASASVPLEEQTRRAASAAWLGINSTIWQKMRIVRIPEIAAAAMPSKVRVPGDDGTSGRLFDLVAIIVSSMTVFVTLFLWLDNAQGITGNGLFKSVTIKGWMADPVNSTLDLSNYLYYPFMAVLCRLLDAIGIHPGDPRHQLPLINAFSAALCLCIVYLLARKITGRRSIAWAVVAFHLAGAFFLNLAIINEDIMPSYTLMFASMALACAWFPEPTVRRVALVATLFTVAWMFEWRLMFPTLPAMLVALALSPGRVVARVGRIVLFLGTMVAVAQIAVWLWGPQNGNAGPVSQLLWTGKGTNEGWAGFSIAKLSFLWIGITEYLVGGSNVGDLSALPLFLTEMLVATFFTVALAAISLLILWRDRESSQIRILAAIFGVTFVAGEVMNAYSQPQDPQMQINIMPWLTVGWALVLAAAVRRHPAPALGTAIAVSVALFAYNVSRIVPLRGQDGAWRLALERIEREVDPTRTIFLVQGFEQAVSEKFYAWDGEWDFFDKLGPAPAAKPKFKLLTLTSGAVHKPSATGKELADHLRGQIDRSMDLGYDVVANVVWDWTEAQLAASLETVADVDKAIALYRMLHERYVASPAFSDPVAGPYFRLRRRQ